MKLSHLLPLVLLASLAVMPSGSAQKPVVPPPIIPSPVKVEPDLPAKEVAQAAAPAVPAAPALPAAPDPAAPAPAAVVPAAPTPRGAVKGGIMLNFQGASLTDVLNYLSEAAGFVIVQEVTPTGTVNIVSRQPISPEEAIDLLNAVLVEKGYVAIRNGRILKIINRKDAQKRDLPVAMGSDPDLIPRKDEMVTQILPLRFGEAAKLVENIRPLLSDNATISANEGSNAILLTDTQTNVRRIAQIIKAVDTSVAGISTIHVYPLQYADAKELATVITQLFPSESANGQNGNRGGGGGGGFGRRGGFPGGFPGMPGAPAAPQSEARQAASRVVAVADQQSNSVIVSAPEETIAIITDIVTRIDTSITDITDTKIFHLEHADAVEMADILSSLYGGVSGTPSAQGQRNRNGNSNQNRPQQQGGQGQAGGSGQSQRALLQSQVVAVGDPRTNSLLVTAAHDTMAQIAEMVGRLDASDTKKQHVYIHSLEHADADSVANVLRGMLGDQTAISNSSQSGSNRLSTRSSTGATMDTSTQTNNSSRR